MQLCLALGVPHSDYLDQVLTWEQFADWVALYRASPWDEERDDARNAVLMTAILAPWCEAQTQIPSPVYPYFEETIDFDFADAERLIEAHKARFNL